MNQLKDISFKTKTQLNKTQKKTNIHMKNPNCKSFEEYFVIKFY